MEVRKTSFSLGATMTDVLQYEILVTILQYLFLYVPDASAGRRFLLSQPLLSFVHGYMGFGQNSDFDPQFVQFFKNGFDSVISGVF